VAVLKSVWLVGANFVSVRAGLGGSSAVDRSTTCWTNSHWRIVSQDSVSVS